MAEPEEEPGAWTIPLEENQRDGPRATVALVDAKVDGLRDYLRAEFGNIKEDVRALGAIVGDVIRHGVDIADHERRITRIENDAVSEETAERDARRIHRPTQIIALCAVLVAVAAVLVPLIAGAYHYH